MNRFDRKYRRIAKGISPLELTSNYATEELSWDDLFTGDQPNLSSDLFLGKYSRDGIRFVMDRFGLDRQARHLGLRNLQVHIDTSDPYRHMLTIYQGDLHDRAHIVMEFVARHQHLTPKEDEAEFKYNRPLKVLMVEWLLLQNPKVEFTTRRPRLPGQTMPGLGLGDQLLALFTLMGRHLQVDGIVNVPQFFHTGLLFGKRFIFLCPQVQAQIHQVSQDLWNTYRLAVIAWASATDSIFELNTGETFTWEPRRQIIPINNQLRSYFKSDTYLKFASQVQKEPVYGIDEKKLRTALADQNESLLIF